MTLTIPTYVPPLLIAGDSWNWQTQLRDFPISDGWDGLEYHFRGPGSLDIVVGVPRLTNDGTIWTVLLAPSDTSSLTPGAYRWMCRASASAGTYAGQKRTALRGVVLIKADLTGAAATDPDELILAQILQEIQARIPGSGQAHVRSMVDGLELWKIDLETLEKMRSRYEARVWRKQHPGKLGPTVGFRL